MGCLCCVELDLLCWLETTDSALRYVDSSLPLLLYELDSLSADTADTAEEEDGREVESAGIAAVAEMDAERNAEPAAAGEVVERSCRRREL